MIFLIAQVFREDSYRVTVAKRGRKRPIVMCNCKDTLEYPLETSRRKVEEASFAIRTSNK